MRTHILSERFVTYRLRTVLRISLLQITSSGYFNACANSAKCNRTVKQSFVDASWDHCLEPWLRYQPMKPPMDTTARSWNRPKKFKQIAQFAIWFYENLPRWCAVVMSTVQRVSGKSFATEMCARHVRKSIRHTTVTNESSNLYRGFESTAYTTLKREREREREREMEGVVTG